MCKRKLRFIEVNLPKVTKQVNDIWKKIIKFSRKPDLGIRSRRIAMVYIRNIFQRPHALIGRSF